jgi:hypothetical protein
MKPLFRAKNERHEEWDKEFETVRDVILNKLLSNL